MTRYDAISDVNLETAALIQYPGYPRQRLALWHDNRLGLESDRPFYISPISRYLPTQLGNVDLLLWNACWSLSNVFCFTAV
jgi:hypothetical protein